MAHILIVDGNPDHQRALGGLIRYRTDSTTVIVDSCVAGARMAVREHPDVILVNVLLYVDGEFAFRRVLGQSAETEGIPILVHCSGRMEALTRRRVEASGAAGVLELPVNAEELLASIGEAMQGASKQGGEGGGVQAVVWPKAEQEEAAGPATTPDGRQVKPVDWGAVADRGPGPPTDGGAAPASGGGKRRAPSGARSEARHSTEPSGTNGRRGGFQASTFPSVDPSQVKGGGKRRGFEETEWPEVDPANVKRRRRRS